MVVMHVALCAIISIIWSRCHGSNSILTTFFLIIFCGCYCWWGERGSKYKSRPLSARQRNAIFRWWPNNTECWLGSFVIFQGGPDTRVPSLDPRICTDSPELCIVVKLCVKYKICVNVHHLIVEGESTRPWDSTWLQFGYCKGGTSWMLN